MRTQSKGSRTTDREMKRFILFIILALPVVAILSTAAGFIYASNMRRVTGTQPITSQPAPVAVVSTSTPARITPDYASLLRIQLSFCYQDFNAIIDNVKPAAKGLRICADNIRKMTPPAEWATAHATALRLADEFEGYANDYEAGVKNLDASKINAATERVQPIGAMLKELVDVLPE